MAKSKNNPFRSFLTREQKIHAGIVEYLFYRYPHVLWWHTFNEGRKTPFERFLFATMGGKKGVSDFIILEPRNGYNGLFLEIKKDGERLHKKNGESYFPEQEEFLKKCEERGFKSCFGIGYDESITIIDEYLKCV